MHIRYHKERSDNLIGQILELLDGSSGSVHVFSVMDGEYALDVYRNEDLFEALADLVDDYPDLEEEAKRLAEEVDSESY